ncbi:MAG TPA: type IV toxin-antitoxin system AbiEi family antitoxin domain-containing protein [Micromonosporaceae bacterium]|nr:type IV toxin-antitoxin system AbiEi family antitoxin domain-containing protein [Micromonosporaceae bacterium]
MARLSGPIKATAPKVDLNRLLLRQSDIATRRQLLASGLDDEDIRREVHAGRWQRLLPGLFACFSGPVTVAHRRIAAALYAPVGAQLTGISALRLYGFRHLPQDERIHLLIPHSSRRTSRGFVLFQRTHRLDPNARVRGGYRICSVARSVADAARQLNELRDVRALVAEAIQNRHTTIPALRAELSLAGSHRTRLFRVALDEVDGGARSAPEAELADELARSMILPVVLWNPPLQASDGSRLPTPDGWIQETGIALEVDSREYHLSPDGWQRTLRRHNELAAHGVLVLHFTPSEIRRRPGRVRRLVEQAHRERLAAGITTSVSVAEAATLPEEGSPIPV